MADPPQAQKPASIARHPVEFSKKLSYPIGVKQFRN